MLFCLGDAMTNSVAVMTSLSKEVCYDPTPSITYAVDMGHGHSHGVSHIHPNSDPAHIKQHQRQTMILATALSVHRVFEGLPIGLSASNQSVWNLTIAVAMHETIISFGLGLQFVRNRATLKQLLIFALVCSLFEPMGAAIGTILSEVGGGNNAIEIANGIIQSISTGTFIYVTFFEILPEEVGQNNASKARFLFLVIGFTCMAALNAIPEETAKPLNATENI